MSHIISKFRFYIVVWMIIEIEKSPIQTERSLKGLAECLDRAFFMLLGTVRRKEAFIMYSSCSIIDINHFHFTGGI